jgi:hypothetical protein
MTAQSFSIDIDNIRQQARRTSSACWATSKDSHENR